MTCFWKFNSKVSLYSFYALALVLYGFGGSAFQVCQLGATLASQISHKNQSTTSIFFIIHIQGGRHALLLPSDCILSYTCVEPRWCPWASFTDLLITCHLLIDLDLGSLNQLPGQELNLLWLLDKSGPPTDTISETI